LSSTSRSLTIARQAYRRDWHRLKKPLLADAMLGEGVRLVNEVLRPNSTPALRSVEAVSYVPAGGEPPG